MSQKKEKKRGKEAFLEYYANLFSGEDDFNHFINSLGKTNPPILRFNPSNETALRQLWQAAGLPFTQLQWYPYALEWPETYALGETLPGYAEHLIYPMSASSLIPVLALNPRAGDTVLDACAAPGGKALFLSEYIPHTGRLVANDASPNRRRRLQDVLTTYGATSVEVWGKKAETLFRTYPDYFDAILVDAPCSSEKHVFQHPHYLSQWSPARIKQLRFRQLAVLSGIFLALKPGGRMVYSTCAVTPEENEGVVAQLLKKKGTDISLLPWAREDLPGGPGIAGSYATDFDLRNVRRILPHVHNLDPMFVALFQKNGYSV